jgi:hypothetical protein
MCNVYRVQGVRRFKLIEAVFKKEYCFSQRTHPPSIYEDLPVDVNGAERNNCCLL